MANATATKATATKATAPAAPAPAAPAAPATNPQATIGATVQATKGNTPANNAATIVAVVANPKRPGTAAHARFAAYKVGQTVAQAVQAGATREDIRWDVKRAHIVLG